MSALSYLHLSSGQSPPDLAFDAFRAVLVIDEPVSDGWRHLVSAWLVRSGCLYMMAWGDRCSAWDDSVDHANAAAFAYGEMPPDKLVMTTWHEGETLKEAFFFAANSAFHPDAELARTLIIHIAPHEREAELLNAYRAAGTQ